ncbi:MAG: CBS domain-containing protein [Gammaproteobacteria bacterium]|nr:CBS domain-containing protein [Gammaproteobacteria bacterium]MDA7971012.1 CBS domain-containing protein [Gammaproteobacteria bacterium]MDA7990077.1 CBS domain-containing protein [Gammaproteobacteria bacterium]MDA8007224.1 CBS domain-containing protein [Gammaproteobacteria bacterium]MDA8011199.1 CBS domain-containing protein [Gammaproteobacteria bacterium]
MSTISSIMKGAGGEVWSVRSDQSVLDALRLMAEKGIGAVPVIDGGKLSGIFSERDYARKVILQDRSSRDTPVREIMSREVTTTTPASSVAECMALMTEKHFRHLPVMEGEKVVGIISIGDLVKAVIAEQQYTISQLENYIAG